MISVIKNLENALMHVFGKVMAKGPIWWSSSQPPSPADIL